MLRIIAIAALLILAAGTPAHAEPISLGLLAFAGITATPGVLAVTTFLVTSALSMGVSLLSNAIFGPDQQPQNQTKPGIQFEIQMGDSNPIAFPVGRTATGGTRRYIGTWGNDGETPNAFLTDVIQIGDLPAPGQPGLWVNGQKCTINWAASPTEQGYPVPEFNVDGKDHLWVHYVDGTQTSVNTFIGGKFGTHPERPWLPNMVGFGCPHIIVTSLFNRELFSSSPTYLIEPPVTPWYDIRKDSTEGGSGSHRWDDQSTWEPTENPIIIAYNICRGVYYTDDYVDEWMFGGQDLASLRLPASAWMAAANECDAERDLEGGGTEPQYRCGMEIRGDMEPLTVVQELMKGCAGRFAENGGIFKPIVGAPGSAVYSFTDGDILVTKGQTYAPFPALSDTHNGIEATYPEPAEAWQSKDAPARYSTELEEEDGERRLATGVSFAAVPYAVQVQQLMRIMIEEERRFRQHSFYLPPDAYPLEPNDVVAWTSARNGYTNKKFIVVSITGERTTNQLVHLKEIDPSDYGWSSAYQMPTGTASMVLVRAPVQPMVGWQALPATFYDDAAAGRRPTIEIRFDGNQVDVRAVRAQVRLLSSGAVVYDGEVPYGDPAPGAKSIKLNGVFLPKTTYEARGIFVPFSGRRTDWSSWLSVTTDDVRLSLDEFEAWIKHRNTVLAQQNEEQFDDVRHSTAQMRNFFASRLASDSKLKGEVSQVSNRMEMKHDRATAYIEEVRTLTLGVDFALAQYKLEIGAELNTPSTGIKARMTTTETAFADLNSAFGNFKTVTESFLYTPVTGLGAKVTSAQSTLVDHGTQLSAFASFQNSASIEIYGTDLTGATTGLKASVTQHGTALTTLNNQVAASWGVDLDVNNFVAGLELVNAGLSLSVFYMRVDKFVVVNPGGSLASAPFVIGSVGGVSQVGINGSLLVDGTIYGSRIIAGTVNALQLAQNGVTVDKIAADAATKVYRTGILGSYVARTGAWENVCSASINMAVAGTATVIGTLAFVSSSTGGGGTTPLQAQETSFYLRILVDGSPVQAILYSPNPYTTYNFVTNYACPLLYAVELTAGVHTITVQAFTNHNSGATLSTGGVVPTAGGFALLVNNKTTTTII